MNSNSNSRYLSIPPTSTHHVGTFAAMKTYSVPPSIVHHIAVNNFVIHQLYLDCFRKYFLLYWEGSHILSQIQDGQVRKDGVDYVVIYHNLTRGRIISNSGFQYACSFREPQPEFGLAAYVLISR